MDDLSTLEKLGIVVVRGVVNVTVLNDVDAILSVEVEHVVVGDLSFIFLNSGHQVDDSGDSILS